MILLFTYTCIVHGFSPGTDRSSVAALFRAIGAHYFNHFTVIFLHGSTVDKDGSDCQLGNLYPVRVAQKLSFDRGKLKKAKVTGSKISFRKGIAKFVEHDFPLCYGQWIQNVHRDPKVEEAIQQHGIEPMFDPAKHLKAAFAKSSDQQSLKNACLNKKDKVKKSNLSNLSKYEIQAANLDGNLLSMIQQYGRKDNISVNLAINNTLGPDDPPQVLRVAVSRIIYHFVMVVINAGLRTGKISENLDVLIHACTHGLVLWVMFMFSTIWYFPLL